MTEERTLENELEDLSARLRAAEGRLAADRQRDAAARLGPLMRAGFAGMPEEPTAGAGPWQPAIPIADGVVEEKSLSAALYGGAGAAHQGTGGAAGTSTKLSRDDHRHPAQISLATAVASDYLARLKETADTQYRLRLELDGSDRPTLLMGPGGSTAPDVRLLRSGAKQATLDDGAGGDITVIATGRWQHLVGGDSQPYLDIVQGGGVKFGPGGATSPDARLIRAAALALRLDDGAGGRASLEGVAGTIPATPAAGIGKLYYSSTTRTWHQVDDAGLDTDLGAAGGGNGTACRITHSAAQATSAFGANVRIPMDTETYDPDGFHFTSAANLTGTVAKTNGSATLTGTGTSFLTELSVGQIIEVPGVAVERKVVSAIATNLSLTVSSNFANTASGQTATRKNDGVVVPPGKGGLYVAVLELETTVAPAAAGDNIQIAKNGVLQAIDVFNGERFSRATTPPMVLTELDLVDWTIFVSTAVRTIAQSADSTPVFALYKIERGGAPSDAEYLTTAASASLSAEKVVDKGAYRLLTRSTNPGTTESDDFNAAPLDAKWITGYSGTATADFTTRPGWLRLTAGSALLQAVPAGDWTIETEGILCDISVASFANVGLILTSGTAVATATDARWFFGMNNNLQDYRYHSEKFINGVFSANYSTFAAHDFAASRIFLRVIKSGTTYNLDYSLTGLTWQRFFQIAALGFTPTHFGVFGSVSALWNYFYRS